MSVASSLAAAAQRLGLLKIKMFEGNFDKVSSAKSFHQLRAKTLEGNEIDFSQFSGKAVLVTNVACECGFTKRNYEQLNELYDRYQGQLEILAFPSNEFGGQESREPAGIRQFVDALGVKFTMMEKTKVNGADAHPVYKAMKQACGTPDLDIKWNFETKFLITKDGKRIFRYSKAMEPKDLIPEIDRVLQESSAKM